jgi:hypothetical protein
MKSGMFNVKRHGVAGPGGWRCTCCGPAPKHRGLFARLHKRRTYRLLDKFDSNSAI